MIRELQDFLDGINLKREKGWEHLYAEYYSPLCCYALKILKDREQAADVVQGVIVRLWESEVRFENLPAFHGYLYKSVYHNCLQALRNKNVKDSYLNYREEQQYVNPEFFAAIIEEEAVRKLRRVIQQMEGKKKEVMLLCLEEKKVEEISKILGISVNTVKKHKKEAYRFIREMLNPDILLLFYLYVGKHGL